MSTALAEAPQPGNAPSPPIMEQMALGTYSQIVLTASSIPGVEHPNQYVGLGDYSVVLPRERTIIVSDLILQEITLAAKGFEHEKFGDSDGKRIVVRHRRDDLNYQPADSEVCPKMFGITAQEAHALRGGPVPVYPEKLTGKVSSAVLDQLKPAPPSPAGAKKG